MTGDQLLRGVPHSTYHQDEVDQWSDQRSGLAPGHVGAGVAPRLSRSIACKLLNESPLHAWAAHPRLGGAVQEDSAATASGSLLHALILGSGPDFVVVKADSYRTDKAKVARDEALAAGQIPVLEKVLDEAVAVAGPLVKQLDEETEEAWSEADKEVTALWREGGVACKARLDALHLERGLVFDLKFTYSAHPDAFGRSMRRNGYDLQHAVGRRAIEAARPELVGRVRFDFLCIEVGMDRVPVRVGGRFIIAAPQIGPTMQDLGEQRWRRAVGLWRRCLTEGRWPAYDTSNLIEARSYELEDEMHHQLAQAETPDWAKGA